MATVTLNASDGDMARIVDALCGLHGYDDQDENPQGREDFAQSVVLQFLAREVYTHEKMAALEAASSSLLPVASVTIS